MEHLGRHASRTEWRALRVVAVAALVLVTVAAERPAAAQMLGEAVEAFERGDYATAYRRFLRAAEQGEAAAQFALGFMYDMIKAKAFC